MRHGRRLPGAGGSALTVKARVSTALVAAVLATLVGASVARAAVTLNLPTDIVVEATGSAGADMTYTVSAADDDGDPVTVSCDSAPEGDGGLTVTATFPLGETTVGCQATDPDGTDTLSGSFKVTVVDTTAPTVTPPAPVTPRRPPDPQAPR